jgi:hypothetical protein
VLERTMPAKTQPLRLSDSTVCLTSCAVEAYRFATPVTWLPRSSQSIISIRVAETWTLLSR